MTFDIVNTTRPSARHDLLTESVIPTEAFRNFARKREMEILQRRKRGMKNKGRNNIAEKGNYGRIRKKGMERFHYIGGKGK